MLKVLESATSAGREYGRGDLHRVGLAAERGCPRRCRATSLPARISVETKLARVRDVEEVVALQVHGQQERVRGHRAHLDVDVDAAVLCARRREIQRVPE